MIIKQISIFMENTTGRLADVTALLAQAGINLRAISIADTTDFGILRMVADQPDEAVKLLKEQGFTARETDVIAVEVQIIPANWRASWRCSATKASASNTSTPRSNTRPTRQ